MLKLSNIFICFLQWGEKARVFVHEFFSAIFDLLVPPGLASSAAVAELCSLLLLMG
jgi:hypothetical protein